MHRLIEFRTSALKDMVQNIVYVVFYFDLVAKPINFGRPVADNCPIFEDKDRVKLPEFKPHHLYGTEGMVFTVEIGQSASEQGYKAITGFKQILVYLSYGFCLSYQLLFDCKWIF